MRERPRTPKSEERWFPPEDKRASKDKRKIVPIAPYPFADRIRLKDGTREMHPFKSAVIMTAMLPMFVNVLTATSSKVMDVVRGGKDASEIINQAVACKGHFSSVEKGYCVTARDGILRLAFPGTGNEAEDRPFIQKEARELTAKLGADNITVSHDGKAEHWFISITAKDDQQLAAWLKELELLNTNPKEEEH